MDLGATPTTATNVAAEAVSTVYRNSNTNKENILPPVNTTVNVSATQPGNSSVVREESLNGLSQKLGDQLVKTRKVAAGINETENADQGLTNKQNHHPKHIK